MSTSMPNAGSPAFYSVKQVAWVFGVSEAEIFRAISTGTLRVARRRSHLVVPSEALRRLLGGAP